MIYVAQFPPFYHEGTEALKKEITSLRLQIELSFTKQLLCANEVTSTVLGFGMSNMTKPCIARSHTITDFVHTQSSVKIVKWLSDCRGNTSQRIFTQKLG